MSQTFFVKKQKQKQKTDLSSAFSYKQCLKQISALRGPRASLSQ